MLYTVNLHEVGVETVKRGVSTPFERIKTGSYATARKTALEFTADDQNVSAVIVNTETGNRLYFQDGTEIV